MELVYYLFLFILVFFLGFTTGKSFVKYKFEKLKDEHQLLEINDKDYSNMEGLNFGPELKALIENDTPNRYLIDKFQNRGYNLEKLDYSYEFLTYKKDKKYRVKLLMNRVKQ